jgi:hypothetical protein
MLVRLPPPPLLVLLWLDVVLRPARNRRLLAGEGCAGHPLVPDDAVLQHAPFDEQLAI